MSLAPEPTLTSPLAETEPAALQAQPTPVPKPSGGLYRVIWRWHFYAGLLVAPVLFTVALTGSLYVFREELEPLLYPGLTVDTPQEKRVSYQAQLDVAVAACPDGKPDSLDIDRDPRRSTIVWMEGEGDRWRLVHVSPYTGAVLGQQQHETGFFSVVLAIHRQLFLGTTGRIVVELTTCWTILLLVTGLYLWLPRKREKLWGVLLPRLRAKPYTVLRDLHAVPGFSLAVVALLIAGTGLYWTFCWGQGFRAAANAAGMGTREFFQTPKSQPSAGSQPVPVDVAIAAARQHWPDRALTVWLPQKPDDSFRVIARDETGPMVAGVLAVDRFCGKTIKYVRSEELPAAAYAQLWFYPIHVGSVFGLPTKILAFLACLTLMGLTVTGVWMWWRRRPKGQTGFPRRPEAGVPRWLVGLIAGLGVFLPTVGVSILLILLGEGIVRRVRLRGEPAVKAVAP